ncbi:o-succinylbenzoate--CoA ligase [Halobacillus locisalis]|uniref:O-succinylbenzoate--CoA ligase n=1 Tax=Halobacillus locisalis TaxID=220753 RepID=A0A838CVD7_9BACI|nr:o-succinylbenzoate--CoA ligase [Halobacillus locisalis]MBA2175904.1 o-succinylbenzoate--CoA ligase [Halobacillus locisalis]
MHTMDEWIHKRGEITPERMAIIGESHQFTYQELSQKVEEMAWMFKSKLHIGKGDRLAILSQNREEYMIAYFAVAQLGAIIVPLNVRLTAAELAFQVNDSGAKALLYEQEMEALYEELSDLANFENAYFFSELIGKAQGDVGHHGKSDDPFIICYTSGTTGKPKGAVLTQENMFWNAINNQHALDLTSDDRTLVILPLFHIGGVGLFALPTLLTGGTMLIPRAFDPEQVIEWIEQYQITVVMGVPTIHNSIRQSPSFEKADFKSVRWFYSGGAPCPKELIQAYLDRGLRFGQGFGMTETAPTVFMIAKEDCERKAGSIGKPVTFCDVRLMKEDGTPAQPGEVGELLIRGPNVMKEYWGLPDETASTIRDGWLYSGDLARQDDEGFFYIAGRKKDMIISGGENIYPLEVEQHINEFREVSEVAVIGVADDKWGEVPVAFVSFHRTQSLQKDDIQAYCRQRLARYKVPKDVIIMSELPKNATGKIDKKAIHKHWMTLGVSES